LTEISRQLARRRAAAADAWDLRDAVVLVHAGGEIPVPGRGDRTYPFRAHSEYLYLTDRERPGGVLAFDPGEGWVEFVEPVTAVELLWSGLEGDREGVPEGCRPLDELEAWVGGRLVRRLGAADDADEALRNALVRVRRPKDDVELERMRVAAAATHAGFAELAGLVAPGRTERELQVALEAAFLHAGGDFLAFESIVAAGDHSAVLHFSPTARELRAGDLLLVDAGAEYRGYASDVTRTYSVGGELGVLRGAPDTLVESGAVTLFFPHGIGHMVGLGVRDAGFATDEAREPAPGLPRLRVDISLQRRHAWTVEPGIYFVPPLLAQHRDRRDVDWARVDALLGFGGVRIEQNVLITDDGCDVLTAAIPL